MKKILVIVTILLSVSKGYSCLNGESKVLGDNILAYEDYEGSIPRGHSFLIDNFENAKSQLDSLYRKTNKIEYLSDKGYILVIEGKYSEALQLYLEIEKKYPNRYSTASNIGTIYELLGENQKALEWINKAIRINPKSHKGSEWLHVKILEAKIKGLNTIDGNFFIDADFGIYDVPVSSLSARQAERLTSSLYYQLNERLSFIQPKDNIIAVLLFELGNLSMIENDYRTAVELFKMAKEYGLEHPVLEKRMSYTSGFLAGSYTNMVKSVTIERYNIEKTILLILSVIIVALLLLYFIRKRTKRQTIKNRN